MADGYISYEYLYYASDYIKQIDNRPGVVIWDDERDEDKRQGEMLQMNGKKHLIKSERIIIFQIYTEQIFMLNFDIMYILISYVLYVGLISLVNAKIEAINKFILYNSEATQSRVALYEEKRMKWHSDKKEFRYLMVEVCLIPII